MRYPMKEYMNNSQEVCMSKIMLIGTTMLGSAAVAFLLSATSWAGKIDESEKNYNQSTNYSIQLGPRPFFFNQ